MTEQPQQSLIPPSCSHTKNKDKCANTLGEQFEDTEGQAGPAKQQDLKNIQYMHKTKQGMEHTGRAAESNQALHLVWRAF